MSASKVFIAAASLCLFGACASIKTEFTESHARNPEFYQSLMPDTCNGLTEKTAAPDQIASITLYKTSFREKLVETGNIITRATLNDASRRAPMDYRPPRQGYRQDMYLARVPGDCNNNVWFYFSVWYKYNSRLRRIAPYGFGKAYMGTAHNAAGTIYFHTALAVKESGDGFRLIRTGKARFYFVLDKLPAERLQVNRIVIEEKNKFGGPSSYVFNVEKNLPEDLQRLYFLEVRNP